MRRIIPKDLHILKNSIISFCYLYYAPSITNLLGSLHPCGSSCTIPFYLPICPFLLTHIYSLLSPFFLKAAYVKLTNHKLNTIIDNFSSASFILFVSESTYIYPELIRFSTCAFRNLTFQKNYATKRLERNDGKSRWKRLCHELFYVFLHWSGICNIIYIYIMYVWYILETQPMRCIGSSRGIGESFSGLLKTRPILIRGCTGGYAPMGCSLFSYLFTPFSDAAP